MVNLNGEHSNLEYLSSTGVEKAIFLAIVEEIQGTGETRKLLSPIAVRSRFDQPITSQLDGIGLGRGRQVAQVAGCPISRIKGRGTEYGVPPRIAG
jgi:hypothetical protein